MTRDRVSREEPAVEPAPVPDGPATGERCDHCGAGTLVWRKCKQICTSCSQINKSCADL